MHLQLHDESPSGLVVNRLPTFSLAQAELSESSNFTLHATSTTGSTHSLQLHGESTILESNPPPSNHHLSQHYTFFVNALDEFVIPPTTVGFKLSTQLSDSLPLRSLTLISGLHANTVVDFTGRSIEPQHNGITSAHTEFDTSQSSKPGKGNVMKGLSESVGLDLDEEVESLRLLEIEADSLRGEIAAKKQAISASLRHYRSRTSLRQLFDECDGLVCKARVVAQRICDKVSVLTEQRPGYATMGSSHLQNMVAFQDDATKPQQTSRNNTKSGKFTPKLETVPEKSNGTVQGLNVPLMTTQNGTSLHDYHFKDFTEIPNPLVRALQLIASILGIAALFSFLRHKCMSVRKRVERAADQEERRNARAYRRAARRARIRRQWDSFVSAINCFRLDPEPRKEDYEEKRALILQDAFLEQLDDLDQAEKGQVMEAEIRELRHAHEIVASMVRVDEHRDDLRSPSTSDPPSSRVPVPYSFNSRSRASTHTLPSYCSESLPDYSSQPEGLASSSTGGSQGAGSGNCTPPTSEGSVGYRRPPSTVSSGSRTRYTPTSSVLNISPRASEETLRTSHSKDTRDF